MASYEEQDELTAYLNNLLASELYLEAYLDSKSGVLDK